MHITPDLAALVAQVYPTLLIAILIEGRMSRIGSLGPITDRVLFALQCVALIGGAAASLIALMVAGGTFENVVSDVLINVTGIAIFLALAVIVGVALGNDLRHRSEIREGKTT